MWPYNLPAHVKYWPEEVRREELYDGTSPGLSFKPDRPNGVRKMSGDEGEKFYMEYWQLSMAAQPQQVLFRSSDVDPGRAVRNAQDTPLKALRPRSADADEDEDEAQSVTNSSTLLPYKPAYLVHTDEQSPLNPHSRRDLSLLFSPARWTKKALGKRDFQCPAGTSNCAAIGRPSSCCGQGETCQLIQDTGLGDVGCCSASRGCSGQIRNCDVGFTGCAGNIGGGCCIPRYVCVSMGCMSSAYLSFGWWYGQC